MGKYMDPATQEVIKAATGQGIAITGPLLSYHKRRPSGTFDFERGFPVSKATKEEGRVAHRKLPAVKGAGAVYPGPYDNLGQPWGALQEWVRGMAPNETGRFGESCMNGPGAVKDPKDFRTGPNWIHE